MRICRWLCYWLSYLALPSARYHSNNKNLSMMIWLLISTLLNIASQASFIFQLECCGAYLDKTYNSWRDVSDSPYPIGAVLVPESCCLQFEESERDKCQRNPTESKFNVAGCFDKLEITFEKNRNVFLAIGLTILITMVIVLQKIVIWT